MDDSVGRQTCKSAPPPSEQQWSRKLSKKLSESIGKYAMVHLFYSKIQNLLVCTADPINFLRMDEWPSLVNATLWLSCDSFSSLTTMTTLQKKRRRLSLLNDPPPKRTKAATDWYVSTVSRYSSNSWYNQVTKSSAIYATSLILIDYPMIDLVRS